MLPTNLVLRQNCQVKMLMNKQWRQREAGKAKKEEKKPKNSKIKKGKKQRNKTKETQRLNKI